MLGNICVLVSPTMDPDNNDTLVFSLVFNNILFWKLSLTSFLGCGPAILCLPGFGNETKKPTFSPHFYNFSSFLNQNLAKNWEKYGKAYFDQCLDFAAPKGWLKYTKIG